MTNTIKSSTSVNPRGTGETLLPIADVPVLALAALGIVRAERVQVEIAVFTRKPVLVVEAPGIFGYLLLL